MNLSGYEEFIPVAIPFALSAEGVGELSRAASDLGSSLGEPDRLALTSSFKETYTTGIFRGVPLTGVLGGDMVHGWPPASPITWVQNWRNENGRRNSWGIPELVLAVRGLSQDRVFLVYGDILNAYGLGKGLNGANGAAGYGAPCGDEFVYQGKKAQRFDYGLISIDELGNSVFIPGAAPSVDTEMPALVGQFQPGLSAAGADSAITKIFQTAWKTGVDSDMAPLSPDTHVITIDFSGDPWVLPVKIEAGGGAEQDGVIFVRNIRYQIFNGGKVLFVLTDASLDNREKIINLPLNAYILPGSFFATLLNADNRLKGAETLDPAQLPAGYDRKASAALGTLLLEGMALYGIPLSAVLPWNDDNGQGEAQRYSRGWLVLR